MLLIVACVGFVWLLLFYVGVVVSLLGVDCCFVGCFCLIVLSLLLCLFDMSWVGLLPRFRC